MEAPSGRIISKGRGKKQTSVPRDRTSADGFLTERGYLGFGAPDRSKVGRKGFGGNVGRESMLNGRWSGIKRATDDSTGRASASGADARQRPSSSISSPGFGHVATAARRLIHLRYLRAGVAGLASAVIGLTALACTLEIQHGVSHRAVFRYLSRGHFSQPDLSRLLGHPETVQRLADMLRDARTTPTVGGLVHVDSGSLRFDRHERRRDERALLDLDADLELYPRLTAAYLRQDLDGLLTELETTAVRQRLEREGVSSLEVPRLRWRSRNVQGPKQTLALIREASRLIHFFFPVQLDGYAMTLAEKLRFYEERNPRGEFVGIFEMVHARLAGNLHESYAKELGGRGHYLAVEHDGTDGSLRIHDYFRGENVGVYRMSPIAHPANLPLFRVEREEPSGASRNDTV